MRLSRLIAALPQPPAHPAADPEIASITADSRQVTPGALFVAVRGDLRDGHDYIGEAIRRGAVAVVGEREASEEKEIRELEQPTAPREVPVVPFFPSVPFVSVPDSRESLAWLSAAYQGFPARRLVMIGITGTDGKTTTANLLHSILVRAGLRAGR